MEKIRVESISTEEVEHGVAELWVEDSMLAYTIYGDDGGLVLRFEPSRDGGPIVVGVPELIAALAEVDRLLAG
jgi:hypothetical protein